eukprot:129846_1
MDIIVSDSFLVFAYIRHVYGSNIPLISLDITQLINKLLRWYILKNTTTQIHISSSIHERQHRRNRTGGNKYQIVPLYPAFNRGVISAEFKLIRCHYCCLYVGIIRANPFDDINNRYYFGIGKDSHFVQAIGCNLQQGRIFYRNSYDNTAEGVSSGIHPPSVDVIGNIGAVTPGEGCIITLDFVHAEVIYTHSTTNKQCKQPLYDILYDREYSRKPDPQRAYHFAIALRNKNDIVEYNRINYILT